MADDKYKKVKRLFSYHELMDIGRRIYKGELFSEISKSYPGKKNQIVDNQNKIKGYFLERVGLSETYFEETRRTRYYNFDGFSEDAIEGVEFPNIESIPKTKDSIFTGDDPKIKVRREIRHGKTTDIIPSRLNFD